MTRGIPLHFWVPTLRIKHFHFSSTLESSCRRECLFLKNAHAGILSEGNNDADLHGGQVPERECLFLKNDRAGVLPGETGDADLHLDTALGRECLIAKNNDAEVPPAGKDDEKNQSWMQRKWNVSFKLRNKQLFTFLGVIVIAIFMAASVFNDYAIPLERNLSATTTPPPGPHALPAENQTFGGIASFDGPSWGSLEKHGRPVLAQQYSQSMPRPLGSLDDENTVGSERSCDQAGDGPPRRNRPAEFSEPTQSERAIGRTRGRTAVSGGPRDVRQRATSHPAEPTPAQVADAGPRCTICNAPHQYSCVYMPFFASIFGGVDLNTPPAGLFHRMAAGSALMRADMQANAANARAAMAQIPGFDAAQQRWDGARTASYGGYSGAAGARWVPAPRANGSFSYQWRGGAP